jgi:hypothetical protein
MKQLLKCIDVFAVKAKCLNEAAGQVGIFVREGILCEFPYYRLFFREKVLRWCGDAVIDKAADGVSMQPHRTRERIVAVP